MLILAGVGLVCLGLIVSVLSRANLPLGRLPGDLVYKGRNTSVYFPWVTCLVVSALLSLLLWLFNRR
jgi:Protein of unknown function (DUF2905)